MDEKLKQAIKILKQGGIVIFPTDTAFGVGCRMDYKKSVERLFNWRRRPATQAVPVLVDSLKMAWEYLLPIKKEVKDLMEKYWPGALTIVYPCKTNMVPGLARACGQTLGIRMPNHPIPLTIINSIGVPILGPSANFHGRPTPYQFKDIDKEFLKGADFVIAGKCPVGNVSTVVDCSVRPWKIIRQGAVEVEFE